MTSQSSRKLPDVIKKKKKKKYRRDFGIGILTQGIFSIANGGTKSI